MVRGGSWNNNQRNARCACRNRNDPDNYNNNVGFRVVLSHNFFRTPALRAIAVRLAGQWMAAEAKELARSIPG